MSKVKDLTGQKFNRLTVKYRGESSNDGRAQWWCECDCGNPELVLVKGKNLLNGNTKSCGYLQKINSTINCKKLFKKYNTYDLSGDYGIGYTAKGESFYFDLEDYDKIKDYYWYINNQGYVATNISNKEHYLMHRIIMDVIDDLSITVDHKHGKETHNDNRKSNLRIATFVQNGQNKALRKDNKTGVTGVNWHEQAQMWVARIGVNNKRIILGFFKDFEEAVKVRKEAEEKYFGEWSYDNSQKT